MPQQVQAKVFFWPKVQAQQVQPKVLFWPKVSQGPGSTGRSQGSRELAQAFRGPLRRASCNHLQSVAINCNQLQSLRFLQLTMHLRGPEVHCELQKPKAIGTD